MLETLIDTYGDGAVLAMVGALVGLLFGAAAQHSRFCLRASTVELAERHVGPRLSIWLIAFSSGVCSVQAAIALGWLDVSDARPLAATGSLSGALIGGLMFGAGMILARGCASRLLVLSASGNLRALVAGLVLTLVAQASLRGILAPAREALAALWTVPGGAARSLLTTLNLSSGAAAVIAALVLLGSFALAHARRVRPSHAVAAALVGLAVGLGWIATYAIAQVSFEVVAISSVTFTGPSTDTLMGLVNETALPLGFGTPMERYLIGATLMGFGSMLAGGCAVGAGMSGGAIFAITAWIAVGAMWIGAMATHLVLQYVAARPALA
jgi:uncharacterized membrane protein YedE/YeeE